MLLIIPQGKRVMGGWGQFWVAQMVATPACLNHEIGSAMDLS